MLWSRAGIWRWWRKPFDMAAAEEGDNPTTHSDGSVSDEDEDLWKATRLSPCLTYGQIAESVTERRVISGANLVMIDGN
jgi:hypothetical protein